MSVTRRGASSTDCPMKTGTNPALPHGRPMARSAGTSTTILSPDRKATRPKLPSTIALTRAARCSVASVMSVNRDVEAASGALAVELRNGGDDILDRGRRMARVRPWIGGQHHRLDARGNA